MNQGTNVKEGNGWALLPILVFLCIFLGSGIITGDFYAMPAIVAFLIALAVAFVQNRKLKFNLVVFPDCRINVGGTFRIIPV